MVKRYLKSCPINRKNTDVQFTIISMEEASQRIDNFLRTHLKSIPRSVIYRIVRKGEVRVNKKRVKPEYKLQTGDELRIPPIRQSTQKPLAILKNLKKVTALSNAILYEDDHLIVLNKPAGTAVHAGSGLSFGVIEGLRALRSEARFLELVHRLDRHTSGVLLISKKRSALRALHQQLRSQEIQKDYLALVRGQWQPHIKVITAPLLKNIFVNGKRLVQVNSQGKPSKTKFKIEECFTHATLVKASPITGRSHQIRVHARHAGHPIAFDERYGDNKFDQHLKECGLNRLFLHASMLRFVHPNNGETLCIKAPLDRILRNCLFYLRAHHQ